MMISTVLFCACLALAAAVDDWTAGPVIGPVTGTNQRIALSSDGTRAITGDYTVTNGAFSNAGKAIVWELTDSTWNQLQSFEGSAADAYYGLNIAISGDGTTIAFSRLKPLASTLVYRYNTGTSAFVEYGSSISFFAEYLDLTTAGNTLVIGNTNKIRVYENSGSGWTQKGQDLDGDNTDDKFEVVAIDSAGTRIAGGTTGNPSGDDIGYIKMFQYSSSNTEWEQMGSTQVGATDVHSFGRAVELCDDGSKVCACASNFGGLSADHSKAYCRVLEYSSGSNQWTQVGIDVVGSINNFGFYNAFSSEGNRLVGASSNSFEVYDYVDSAWTKVGTSQSIASGSIVGLDMTGDGALVATSTNQGTTSTYSNYPAASAEGDPWAVMGNDKIKFDSKSRGVYEELLLWSDKIILASTYESKDSFLWFDSFQFKIGTSHNIEVKLQTQLDPNQKTCNSMSVKVDGNFYLISDNATAAGDNRMKFGSNSSILAWKEQGFVGSCASNVFMIVTPELDTKLVTREGDERGHANVTWTKEQAIRNAHLDMQAEKVKDKKALRGPLAEMWGLTPLTDKVKSWIVDSEKGSSKSIAYPNHY